MAVNSRGKMCNLKLVAVLLLAVASVDLRHIERRPSFIGCVDSSECSKEQCCVLGGGRYSSPQCTNLGEVGDSCRPYGTVPFNTTVDYPNGYSATLTNVHFIMCDCATDLVCDRDSSTCQLPQILTRNSVL
ncbi:astakine-like [Zootermopsis nevadensis]|uniref:Astakine n=1 Tax=Zootermopsis nevadensis TaxID=136037 RepID=A0A067QZH0_ZOONE|nr:astakine-like [Zootermopsis nevadensis]KDR15950.1 Astakine [Zootermopsis nevadensis]